MNKQDEIDDYLEYLNLFCERIAALWAAVILLAVSVVFCIFFLVAVIEKIEKIEESLDNEPIEIKIEGSWEQFGKLTFNDRVLTKGD